jgi:hypothetical protein
MGEQHHEQIVKRIAWGLGGDWKVDPVTVNGPLSVVNITYTQDQYPRDFCTLSWPVEQDADVIQGAVGVMAAGQYNGKDVFEEKPVDEVTAFLRDKVPGYFEPKKKWFGRGAPRD